MRKPFKSHHQRHLPSIAVASLVVFQFSSCQTLPLNSCFELLNDAARDWRYRNIHNYNHNNQDSVEEDLFLEPSTLKLGVGGGGVTCILPPLASPEAENTDNHQQMAQEYSSKYPELAIYCERRHHIVKNKHNRLRRRMEHESKEGGMSEPAAIHLNPQAPVKRGGSGRNGAPARDLYIGWSRSSGGSGSAAQQFKPPLLPVHGGGGSRSRGSSFSGSRKDLPSPISLSDLKSRSSSSSLPSGEVLKSPIYCSPFGFDPLSSPWSPGTASIYMRSPGPREVMPDSAVRGAMSAYEAGDVATGRRASVSAAASILCPPLLIANAFVANYCKSPGGLSSLRSPGSSRPRSFTGSTPRLVSTDNFADRSKWMARFHEFNIFQIYIPGTHNSGAYMVDVRDESQRDNWQERQLVKTFPNWVTCQKLSIKQQLTAGVRSLDLRVATIARNTVIAHRFPNIPLETALRDVKDFVTENPSEVVIIQFKADWDNREDVNWVEVVAKFRAYIEGLAVPETMADESLGKIVLNKRNIIIINHESNDELMVKHLTVWRHDRIVDKWYDTQKLGVLQEKLTTDLLGPMVTSSLSSSSTPRSEVAVPLDGRQRGSSSFINIQAILTANVGIYIEEFLTKSLGPFVELAIVRKNSGNEVWKNTQHMAEAANQVLFDIFTLKMAELDIKTVAANIIQTDFINDDIIGLILEMNEVDDEDTELSFSLEEEMDDKITFTK